MPLTNIIDERDNPFRFSRINAKIEPTCHDNSVIGAEQVDHTVNIEDRMFTIAERYGLSLTDAVQWANTFKAPVTLYLSNGWSAS